MPLPALPCFISSTISSTIATASMAAIIYSISSLCYFVYIDLSIIPHTDKISNSFFSEFDRNIYEIMK